MAGLPDAPSGGKYIQWRSFYMLPRRRIEVAKKLVEAMSGRQELILVAQMVLAELSDHVADGVEQLGDCRGSLAKAQVADRRVDETTGLQAI